MWINKSGKCLSLNDTSVKTSLQCAFLVCSWKNHTSVRLTYGHHWIFLHYLTVWVCSCIIYSCKRTGKADFEMVICMLCPWVHDMTYLCALFFPGWLKQKYKYEPFPVCSSSLWSAVGHSSVSFYKYLDLTLPPAKSTVCWNKDFVWWDFSIIRGQFHGCELHCFLPRGVFQVVLRVVSGAIMMGPIQLHFSAFRQEEKHIDWKPRQQSHERENIYGTVVEMAHVFISYSL